MSQSRFNFPIFFRHGSSPTPFNQQLNDMVRTATRWVNDISGTSEPETDIIPSITSSLDTVKGLVTASFQGEINLNKVWSSPLFPLWVSIIRYNEAPKRIPVSFTYGVSHRKDVKLYVLDGAKDIGWVERVPKWGVDGVSIDTGDYEGSPVMVIRQSTIDGSFPSSWSQQKAQDELSSQIFRCLQDRCALYHASRVVPADIKSTTPFVPTPEKTPPSFLGEYLKRDVFDAFKAGVESSISGNTSEINLLKQDIRGLTSTEGLDDLKNQVALNKNELYTQNTRIEWNSHLINEHISRLNEIEDKTVVNGQSIRTLQNEVQGVKLVNDSIRSEQAGIKQDIKDLKASHLNPDDFVTKTAFWNTVEQMPTTQGMRGEIRDAIEQAKLEVSEDHYTKQEADSRFASQQGIDTKITQATSGMASVSVVDTKVRSASDAVKADTESKYVKKSEVEDLKKLQEQLGKVDISSFATRSQLAQQQQTIEGWSNQRFELKGVAGNLDSVLRQTITSETDSKIGTLNSRINAAVNETNELRKSTRQNLDSLSSTVSTQDTRITNGLSNLKTELQNSIDRKMPNLSASDGMLVVADNAVAEKWKASHYSLSVDNLIKEREEGFILNGTGRMTDGTGRGGFDYSTVAFNGSSGSFSVAANQTSERNIFFTDRIKLKEKVFKVTMDVRQTRVGTSKFRLNIRWFTRSGVEMSNYLRKEQSMVVGPSTIGEWVIAPSDAEFCEVGIVNGTGNPVQLFTNIKVQFAQDIPEEILWQFVLGEQYRHEKFAETPIWINCYVTTHNTINVQGIVNRADLVPVGATLIGGTNLPVPLSVPYFNLNSPYGGLYPVQSGSGLSLEARFNIAPPQGLRMGTSFKPLSDIRHLPFNSYSKVGAPIAKRPMVGLNNNGLTGY